MYTEHTYFSPIITTQKIWHYFSLSKFLGLISKSSIYLCRQDKFDDKYEGTMTKKDEAFFNSVSPDMCNKMKGDSIGCVYYDCWTKSDVDEYVLWSTYSSLKDGVAIQSSVGNLILSLDPKDKRHVYASDVQYIDYESDWSFVKTKGIANMLAPHFSKRSYFSAEKEFRVLYWDSQARYNSSPVGLDFKVDLNKLIEW